MSKEVLGSIITMKTKSGKTLYLSMQNANPTWVFNKSEVCVFDTDNQAEKFAKGWFKNFKGYIIEDYYIDYNTLKGSTSVGTESYYLITYVDSYDDTFGCSHKFINEIALGSHSELFPLYVNSCLNKTRISKEEYERINNEDNEE